MIINPDQVYFLKFILEGYDNLFLLSTLDRQKGLVSIIFPKTERELLNMILTALKQKINYELIDCEKDIL